MTEVVVRGYGRDAKNDGLVEAMALVEPARAAAILSGLVRGAVERHPSECVDLFGRIVDEGPREVAVAVAEALVDALPGNPVAKPKRAWRPWIEPAFVVAALRGLWRLGEAGLAERAAERASAWYPLDRVLLPAALALAPEATGQPGWSTLRAACIEPVSRRVPEPDVVRTLAVKLLVRPLAFRAPTEAASGLVQDVPALFDAVSDTEILRELREVRGTWLKEGRPDCTR